MKHITLFILSLMLSSLLFAQKTGNLQGMINDTETGERVSSVEVFIPQINKGAVTDKKGHYNIPDIPEGTYTVMVKALGYKSILKENIEIVQGEPVVLNFDLDIQAIAFDEITISATKLSTTINKISSPVYVISRQLIDHTEKRNIEEALTTIPGVMTEDRHHGEANVVSFRGVGLHTHVTRGILVLVDGVAVNEADGRTSFEGIDMENAESIEVLKGPVSALYGPNGITGVINVKEKEPQKGIHGDVRALYGSFNTQRISANLNGGTDQFKYMIKAGHYYSERYQDRSEYGSNRVGLKLSNNFGIFGKLMATADYIVTTDDGGGPLDSALFAERSTLATRKFTGNNKKLYRVNLQYNKAWNNQLDFQTNIYGRGRHDEGHYLDTRWANDDINLMGAEARLKKSYQVFSLPNKLVFGLSIDNEKGKTKEYARDGETGIVGELVDEGESNYNMLAFYAENELSIRENLTLTLGLRLDQVAYEWIDQFNTGDDNTSDKKSIGSVSPKIGMAFNPNKTTTLFGNIGKGFNPPLISQLFIGSSYSGLPNKELKPEYLTNYEVGVRSEIMTGLSFQISAFIMDFENQIVAEIDEAISNRVPVYKNVGKTKHQGIELAVNYSLKRKFNTFLSYSYLDTKFTDYPGFTGNTLLKAPHNKANAGVSYTFDFGLTASASYIFVDQYFMDNENVNTYGGHSLLNTKITYKHKAWTASVGIENLTDVNYATWAYASQSYNPATHQSSWEKMYYAGWPRNYTFSLGYHF